MEVLTFDSSSMFSVNTSSPGRRIHDTVSAVTNCSDNIGGSGCDGAATVVVYIIGALQSLQFIIHTCIHSYIMLRHSTFNSQYSHSFLFLIYIYGMKSYTEFTKEQRTKCSKNNNHQHVHKQSICSLTSLTEKYSADTPQTL